MTVSLSFAPSAVSASFCWRMLSISFLMFFFLVSTASMRLSRVFLSVLICSSRFFSSCWLTADYLHLFVFGERGLQLAGHFEPRDAHALEDEVFDL